MYGKIVYRRHGRYKCPFCMKGNKHTKTSAIAAYRKRWYSKAKPTEVVNTLTRIRKQVDKI